MVAAIDPRGAWARYTQARSVLGEVATALARAGVDVLAVKGIVTVGWLYADPSERPFGDIDVRIRPADFRTACAAVKNLRWPVGRRAWAYRNLVFVHGGFTIDLESFVGPPGLCALRVDAMLGRATRDPAGFWVPDTYDHAVLLTVNVFKDKLTHAMGHALDDVVRVLRQPGFDLERFVARLREARSTAIGWVVADWMVRERQSDGWRQVRARLGDGRGPRPVYARALGVLAARGATKSLAFRTLTRIGSDDRRRWPSALARSAAWEVERRWDAWRRSGRD